MSFYSRRSSYWDQYDYIDQNPICNKRALPENNVDDNECKLKEVLNDTWFHALASTIKSNTDSPQYVGPETFRSANIIPHRSNIFRCLNINTKKPLHPSQWKVIIVGDSPSAKTGRSSSGIPFYDSTSIRHWIDEHHSNSSIQYFYFNLLQMYGMINDHKQLTNYDEMMQYIMNVDISLIPQPHKWIQHTMEQGVMWIHQCLTIGGNKEKHQHHRYWKPILRAIFYTILSSKKNLKKRDGNKGTLFVVFDKKTKNFIRSVQSQVSAKKRTQIKIVKMDYDFSIHFKSYFNDIKFFQKINEGLHAMMMDTIEWLRDDDVYALNKWRKKNNSAVNGDNDNQKNKNKKEANVEDKDKKTVIDAKEEHKYDDGVDSDEFSC